MKIILDAVLQRHGDYYFVKVRGERVRWVREESIRKLKIYRDFREAERYKYALILLELNPT